MGPSEKSTKLVEPAVVRHLSFQPAHVPFAEGSRLVAGVGQILREHFYVSLDTAISRRLAVTPIHVYQSGEENGRETKVKLPDHPIAQLLKKPNSWQSRTDFWMDAASTWVRYGNFYAYKSQGGSGRIAELIPLDPDTVEPKLEDNRSFYYRIQQPGGNDDVQPDKILHARGRARNFIKGDSPIRRRLK